VKENKKAKYLCPVCEKHFFEEEGDDDICPVCDWQNCTYQNQSPDFSGMANHMSLNEARTAYRRGEPVW